MARYECPVCGYIYDEEQEDAPWDTLSGDWVCPGCGAGKDLFTLVASTAPPPAEAQVPRIAGSKSFKTRIGTG